MSEAKPEKKKKVKQPGLKQALIWVAGISDRSLTYYATAPVPMFEFSKKIHLHPSVNLHPYFKTLIYLF